MSDRADHQPTVTRAMVQDAVRALGLNPNTVSAVKLERHIVTVTHLIPVVADRIYEIRESEHE